MSKEKQTFLTYFRTKTQHSNKYSQT